MGRENGEPSYTESLRKCFGINKCDNDITKNDFIKHDLGTREFLAKRFNNNWSSISLTYGADLEDHQGEILGPTVACIITEQIIRAVCGDRYFWTHAPFFREGKE